RKTFVREMKDRRTERRERFGAHSYLLEPHLKEGRGGLRDMQAMLWTARVVFGLSSLDDIEDAGLLLPDEKQQFQVALDFLKRLRIRLHYLSKRKNDRLYFELQAEVAEAFGYLTDGSILPVEAFMRDLYSQLECVSLVTDLFFDHVDEVLGLEAAVEVQDRLIEKGIEVRRGKLHLTADRQMVEKKPHIVVRLFLAMARTGLPLHHRTRKLVSSYAALLQGQLLQSPRLNKPILSILLEAKDIFSVLEIMLESRVLPAVIPELQGIVSLAQHDLYHIYTVDRHSLQTVAELRGVVEEYPMAFSAVDVPAVLYLSALLHDVGKGAGRDHSEVGAEVVGGIARRFGFSEEQCSDIEFLVLYHLFIPENALRRDLNDTAFIQRCAEIIGTTSRLAMLYLLSVADSRATGPSAWSDWKGALMNEMYLKVLAAIEHAEEDSELECFHEHVEQGVGWLRRQLADLLAKKEVIFDQDVLPADYLLSFDVDTVLAHIKVYQEKYNLLRQKSYIEPVDSGDEWQLLCMSLDRPGLLA
ncbi:MAG TPA: HD domain-containing protein, partial [Candidatus Atribacteria bacterium]|nr:HD domain-containing protein [Candidatus Atribacteria bacterium]